jgi:hypothetical protein
MRYPLTLCARGTLVIAADGYFDHIARVDLPGCVLEINVTASGRAGLAWALDADAVFFEFHSNGLLPRTLPQRLGLRRAREAYSIAPGRTITAGELLGRIAGLQERLPEAPNAADLAALLRELPASQVISARAMKAYLRTG